MPLDVIVTPVQLNVWLPEVELTTSNVWALAQKVKQEKMRRRKNLSEKMELCFIGKLFSGEEMKTNRFQYKDET